MNDSPSNPMLPANTLAASLPLVPPASALDRDRMGSDRGALGRPSDPRDRRPDPPPSPENPDTFTGLLARFDAYLAQLQKAESALEEHADKLVTIDPDGPARTPQPLIGDDKANSVIRRLQNRIDCLSALTSAISRHQERADRAF